MTLADKDLTCVECNAVFIFTSGEQEFFESKGYTNEPKRCPTCRQSRRYQQRGSLQGERELHPINCADCGAEAMVPSSPAVTGPSIATTVSAATEIPLLVTTNIETRRGNLPDGSYV